MRRDYEESVRGGARISELTGGIVSLDGLRRDQLRGEVLRR